MTNDGTTLLQDIDKAAQGLLFPSESDFPIESFSFGEAEPTAQALLEQRGLAADTRVEQTTLASLFKGLVEAPDDASESERKSAEQFAALMKLLESNLDDIRVYRLGQVEIDVFVLGRSRSGTWLGVRTNVVET